MRQHLRWRRWLAVVALLIVPACSSSDSGTVVGVVVDVVGTLDEIDEFSILVDGEVMTFVPTDDGDYAFHLGHLRDHLRSGEPVEVGWELDNGTRVATFLDDA